MRRYAVALHLLEASGERLMAWPDLIRRCELAECRAQAAERQLDAAFAENRALRGKISAARELIAAYGRHELANPYEVIHKIDIATSAEPRSQVGGVQDSRTSAKGEQSSGDST
jgi:hypothetical protein